MLASQAIEHVKFGQLLILPLRPYRSRPACLSCLCMNGHSKFRLRLVIRSELTVSDSLTDLIETSTSLKPRQPLPSRIALTVLHHGDLRIRTHRIVYRSIFTPWNHLPPTVRMSSPHKCHYTPLQLFGLQIRRESPSSLLPAHSLLNSLPNMTPNTLHLTLSERG